MAKKNKSILNIQRHLGKILSALPENLLHDLDLATLFGMNLLPSKPKDASIGSCGSGSMSSTDSGVSLIASLVS